MELDERKLKILQAIINDYITTAVPVGSRTISRKYLEWSSATIRNEMSDLEELGYLDQPHTSAGRVPSDKAYRLYVDRLMRQACLTDEERRQIGSFISQRRLEVETVMRRATDVLSEVTQYTSMVLLPRMRQVTVQHMQLVPVTRGTALLVLVTDSGMIKDAVIRIPEDVDEDMLGEIIMMLNRIAKGKLLSGLPVAIGEAMRHSMDKYRAFFVDLADIIREASEEDSALMIGGASNMLKYPEYADIDKARQMLELLEGKSALKPILQRAFPMEFTITIGKENEFEPMRDCSVVTATYRLGGKPYGSFGVIGPTRMNYERVVTILDAMRHSLSQILTEMLEPSSGEE